MSIETTLAAYDREIGIRIRLRRKALAISQTQLGETIGVTFQQIQKYERGTNRVSSSALVGIAQALGVKPSELLDDLAGDATVAAPTTDLVRDLLDAPHGLAIARSLNGLSARDAGLVASFAARLAELSAAISAEDAARLAEAA